MIIARRCTSLPGEMLETAEEDTRLYSDAVTLRPASP